VPSISAEVRVQVRLQGAAKVPQLAVAKGTPWLLG
jgi:hypothetical protein